MVPVNEPLVAVMAPVMLALLAERFPEFVTLKLDPMEICPPLIDAPDRDPAEMDAPVIYPPEMEPPLKDPAVMRPPLMDPPVMYPPEIEPPVMYPPLMLPPVMLDPEIEADVIDPVKEPDVATMAPVMQALLA
jgi:hypothetical protein